MNQFIKEKCKNAEDKRVFIMFIMMYFYSYLSNNTHKSKESIKLFLSNLIKNPESRQKCINLYIAFENNTKMISDYQN